MLFRLLVEHMAGATLVGLLAQPQRHHAPAHLATPTNSFRCLLASWLFLLVALGAWRGEMLADEAAPLHHQAWIKPSLTFTVTRLLT